MSPPISPTLEFNYDISCPFAYIASTRVRALAARTNATLSYRPVLLGAIYRATSAPHGASGSASDAFNPTKRAVGQASMARTLARYRVPYSAPPHHPRKTVSALRLLYCVPDGDARRKLSEKLFAAYWVEGRDVSDEAVVLEVARESGLVELTRESFGDAAARRELERATADVIARGAFGVPGFWIENAVWVDVEGKRRRGRFFWGQDRMHFVEATLLSLGEGQTWKNVEGLKSLMPRCVGANKVYGKVRLEFWYDFSSPWGFLGYTQLARLQRMFGSNLEIVMKPFLLGILFREIGAPNLPMAAVSKTKAQWSRQDHADWTAYWNAVNAREGSPDQNIDFYWADVFPIRTPTVLKVAIAEPKTVPLLYSACWEHNSNVSEDTVLAEVLIKGGFSGAELIAKANSPAIKANLREFTAEAKSLGLCGVPTYRVLRKNSEDEWALVGGIIWGQDETNVIEDLIAGWDQARPNAFAEPREAKQEFKKLSAQL